VSLQLYVKLHLAMQKSAPAYFSSVFVTLSFTCDCRIAAFSISVKCVRVFKNGWPTPCASCACSNTTVSVQILDVNDNRPRFQASRYYGRVEEDYDGNRTLRNVLSVNSVHSCCRSKLATADGHPLVFTANLPG